jgi:hypothetical protein
MDPTLATTTMPPAETDSEGEEGTTMIDPTNVADPSSDPTLEPSTGSSDPECGNGMVENGERCDGDDLDGNDCTSLGFEDGELGCADTCMGFRTANCYTCGNGTLEGPETCDGGVSGSVTCVTQGFTEGEIACNAETCELDLTGCSLCGDGKATVEEPCDGDDLGGETCASIGFDGGDLACRDACLYDVSACEGGQFIEDWEGMSIDVPPWGFSGNADWVIDNSNPIGGAAMAGSGVITHDESSGLTINMTFPSGGQITFWHSESTESCCDYLEFYIDGSMQDSWSGAGAATEETYDVDAGEHDFEWRYTKDFSVNTGQDQVWIDDIFAEGGGPI